MNRPYERSPSLSDLAHPLTVVHQTRQFEFQGVGGCFNYWKIEAGSVRNKITNATSNVANDHSSRSHCFTCRHPVGPNAELIKHNICTLHLFKDPRGRDSRHLPVSNRATFNQTPHGFANQMTPLDLRFARRVQHDRAGIRVELPTL